MAFGVRKTDRGAALEESLAVIKCRWTEDEVSFEGRFDDYRKDRVIVGDPDHCIREFRRYHDEVGIDHFSGVLNSPGMQHWPVLRSIRLLGERVLPALR